jgi:hypothetical protein
MLSSSCAAIDPDRDALERFVRSVDAKDLYVSREAVEERRGQFNVVLLESGWKCDLILRKHRAFSDQEFARRQPAEIAGVRVFVATAEDTIVAKRQIRDVVGVLQMRAEELDTPYIERWVVELGLAELWEQARREAQL